MVMDSNSGEDESSAVDRYATMRGGILTDGQRRYLLDRDQWDGSDENQTRNRIRESVLNTFIDFRTLSIALDPKDRKLIFERMAEVTPDELVEQGMESKGEVKHTKESRFTGAVAALEFIYMGMIEAGFDPEQVLDLVRERVGVPELTEDRLDSMMNKIETGESLTSNEVELMKYQIVENPDEFKEQINELDIDAESIIHSVVANAALWDKTRLSAGKSFVVLGYILEDPSRAKKYPNVPQLLHNEVSTIVEGPSLVLNQDAS